MPKRTLASCWKQYEKMATTYLNGESDKAAVLRQLQSLTRKANGDKTANALESLFVRPYISLPIQVEFACDDHNELPKWHTCYDAEESFILIHPVSVFSFIDDIRKIVVPDIDEDEFVDCRYACFLSEMSKLSKIYILFLLVLQRVAYLLEIAHLEKRGGVIEVAEGEAYHTMLWAFKELEAFAKKTYGMHIRSNFGISWYESDWITGR